MKRHDPSTNAIVARLTPDAKGARAVTTSHAGVDSVHAGSKNFLKKPKAHSTPVKDSNAATNAALNRAASPTPSVQPTDGELVGAGIITPQ
jgi:hypothetical protein